MARPGNGMGHGPGLGAGWGGPAQIWARVADQPRPHRFPPPGNRVAGYGHNLSRSQKRQHLLDALFDLALTGASQELQVSAAVAWLNRYEGRPVAMTVHASAADLSTLDDADLEHELRLHAADTQAKRQKN